MKKLVILLISLISICGCSSSDDIPTYEDGYDDGYGDGYDSGYSDGFSDGYDEAPQPSNINITDSDIYNKGFFDAIEIAMECVQNENLSDIARESLEEFYDKYYDYVYGDKEEGKLLPGLPPGR